jgi:hypothetical protein
VMPCIREALSAKAKEAKARKEKKRTAHVAPVSTLFMNILNP